MIELTTPDQAANWLKAHVTRDLQTDSRKVRVGDGFMAWAGGGIDARDFVLSSMQSGAKACLVEHDDVARYQFDGAAIASYLGLKAASGPIAAAFLGHPSKQLQVVAITGTNGKTSTSWWLAHALSGHGFSKSIGCGVVGTLGIGYPSQSEQIPIVSAQIEAPRQFVMTSNGLTTPDAVQLQGAFGEFVKHGLLACAVEASSIGIEENRLLGTEIRIAVFTNFTQDHLDYHKSMQAYWLAKTSLFLWPSLAVAVINIDDPKGVELVNLLSATGKTRQVDVWTLSSVGPARLQAIDISYTALGLKFWVVEGKHRSALSTRAIGLYNVDNLLAVVGVMRAMGLSLDECVAACSSLGAVPGRMECLGGVNQPLVAVDYAHTPDALQKSLEALRPLAKQRGGQLWCVFGCGGNRDKTKRPVMGRIAHQGADKLVVTNDNPRRENALEIVEQILAGFDRSESTTIQLDRGLAIEHAIGGAEANDVVLLAGKGHEDYQEIEGIKIPFSDRQQVALALNSWSIANSSVRSAAWLQ